MRFFSNDSPNDVDDEFVAGRPDDRVTRDPDETMPVPQQRAGSPWRHDSDPATANSPQQTAAGTPPQPTMAGAAPATGTGTAQPENDPDADEPGLRDATIDSPARDDVSRDDEPLLTDDPAGQTTGDDGRGSPTSLFPAADTQPLRDRWRDVQLRFVDDPKAATGEAAGLVDEAVDKLSKALRDQRGSLAKGSDDTEQLRVEFRGYRDIMDRLLGL